LIYFTDSEIYEILNDIEKKYRKEKAKKSSGRFPSHAIFALNEVKKRVNKLKKKKLNLQKAPRWTGWRNFFDLFKKN
jgi:hypothetical protein